MPHGLGHMMGLDVHDMEDLGQIYVGYDDETRPIDQFGTSSLRMGRRLQEGFVITDEPGCYFIPALIDQWRAQGMHKEFLNYDKIETFKDFGGIRLEDDILIIPGGSRFLGDKRTPITVEEVEEIMQLMGVFFNLIFKLEVKYFYLQNNILKSVRMHRSFSMHLFLWFCVNQM